MGSTFQIRERIPLALPRCRELDLVRHVQVLLRYAARIVGRQHAGDLRVANVDVRVMLRRFSRFGDPRNEGDSVRESLELESLG